MDSPENFDFYHDEKPIGGLRVLGVLAGLAVIAAMVFAGWWFWIHRNVRVTINGRSIDVMYHSTLDDVYFTAGIIPMPGDLYSITGTRIQTGGGEPYAVLLDGTPLTEAEQRSLRIEGYESFSVRDGEDTVEGYTVIERDELPRLIPAGGTRAVTFVRQWGVSGRARVRVGNVSGEEVIEEMLQEPQDCVLESLNPVPSDGRKLVCLTFDDGPSEYTYQILDILREKGARATFFCLGSSVLLDPEAVRAIEGAGCEVMSHTMNHENHFETSSDETHEETVEAYQVLSDYAGVSTTVLRPPYGNWNEYCWISTRGTTSASVIWNIDSLDWEQPGADAIVENCTTGVGSGDIILMHDGGGDRSQDIEALPQIIDKLREQGFEFVTLSELMASDYRIPDEVSRQYAPMPEGCDWPVEVVEG